MQYNVPSIRTTSSRKESFLVILELVVSNIIYLWTYLQIFTSTAKKKTWKFDFYWVIWNNKDMKITIHLKASFHLNWNHGVGVGVGVGEIGVGVGVGVGEIGVGVGEIGVGVGVGEIGVGVGVGVGLFHPSEHFVSFRSSEPKEPSQVNDQHYPKPPSCHQRDFSHSTNEEYPSQGYGRLLRSGVAEPRRGLRLVLDTKVIQCCDQPCMEEDQYQMIHYHPTIASPEHENSKSQWQGPALMGILFLKNMYVYTWTKPHQGIFNVNNFTWS